MHGVGGGHVAADLVDHPALRPGEAEREGGDELLHQPGAPLLGFQEMGDPLRGGQLALLGHGQRHLQTEELVEHEPAAGGFDFGHALGKVDGGEGAVPVDQPVSPAHLGGQRVGDRAGPLQGVVDAQAHERGADLPHRGMHGHHPAHGQALVRRVEEEYRGRVDLEPPPVAFDLPRQRHLHPPVEAAGLVRLVEPHGPEGAGAVADHRLYDDHPPPGAPHRHPVHPPDHGCLGALLHFFQVHPPRPVDVPPGNMEQHIGDRTYALAPQHSGALAPQKLDPLHPDPVQIGQAPPGALRPRLLRLHPPVHGSARLHTLRIETPRRQTGQPSSEHARIGAGRRPGTSNCWTVCPMSTGGGALPPADGTAKTHPFLCILCARSPYREKPNPA